MKLHLSLNEGLATFTGYGPDYVAVNGRRHETNLAVRPTQVTPDWTKASFETLTEADFAYIAGQDIEIALLGTGATLRFPSPALLKPLVGTGIGLEVMDTPAACRTYNILMAEGRKVGAFLLLA